MKVFDLIGGDVSSHYECRDCGTNLDDDTVVCPDCGGEPVAYDVE